MKSQEKELVSDPLNEISDLGKNLLLSHAMVGATVPATSHPADLKPLLPESIYQSKLSSIDTLNHKNNLKTDFFRHTSNTGHNKFDVSDR
mmetsp:Transcript_12368/g.19232  ORF Transcript_12368/g.19232 Transcript_12368/m.19232 type:complete len:90 (+) Transcript_12368:1998-2267(+)